jgi:Lrp/AsnC family leucine-responsive transcriptional regulator
MLSRIDLAILAALEESARLSYSELSERVGLSKTPCWQRVQALEKAGVIRGYRASLDRQKLSLGLTAHVQVIIDFNQRAAFENAVISHNAIIACHTTAGEADYLLEVVATDVQDLDKLLREDLCLLPGVQRFNTTLCLKTIKDAGGLTAAAQVGRGR